MLSLIRPSSSPCSHSSQQDSLDLCPTTLVPAPAPINIAATIAAPEDSSLTPSVSYSSTLSLSSLPSTPTISSTPRTRPQFKLTATQSIPLNNATSYKALVAQFTANAPQPYGVIPPRKKRTTRPSSTINNNSGSIRAPKTSKRTSLPPHSSDTPVSSLELLPTSSVATQNNNKDTNGHTDNGNPHIHNDKDRKFIEPFFHSLQALLPESTSSSSRLGFWANLKAQYLASATSFTWSLPGNNNGINNGNTRSARQKSSDALLPPAALRVANSAPVAAVVDATSLSASSYNPLMTLSDAAILSLPNLASPSSTSSAPTATTVHSYHGGSISYPVSFAAMDKFKVVRSDTIPLKTFTYLETPVVERPRPRAESYPSFRIKSRATKTTGTLSPPSSCTNDTSLGGANAVNDSKRHSLLPTPPPPPPPLPRHLLARETRSNADYLRMMAAELRMIRSRKLISPLRPRGYLPRRKDPFRYVKSSLCKSIVRPCEEDDHPLNDVMVGSWSSTASSDTFMSTSSSAGYHTPQEELYQYF